MDSVCSDCPLRVEIVVEQFKTIFRLSFKGFLKWNIFVRWENAVIANNKKKQKQKITKNCSSFKQLKQLNSLLVLTKNYSRVEKKFFVKIGNASVGKTSRPQFHLGAVTLSRHSRIFCGFPLLSYFLVVCISSFITTWFISTFSNQATTPFLVGVFIESR